MSVDIRYENAGDNTVATVVGLPEGSRVEWWGGVPVAASPNRRAFMPGDGVKVRVIREDGSAGDWHAVAAMDLRKAARRMGFQLGV
jgi:hypothetical protein